MLYNFVGAMILTGYTICGSKKQGGREIVAKERRSNYISAWLVGRTGEMVYAGSLSKRNEKAKQCRVKGG
jgi:hypothetical protein